jgi:hypothetical protein
MGELINKAEMKLNKLEREIHDMKGSQKRRAKQPKPDDSNSPQQNIPLAL